MESNSQSVFYVAPKVEFDNGGIITVIDYDNVIESREDAYDKAREMAVECDEDYCVVELYVSSIMKVFEPEIRVNEKTVIL